jgi:hypothetical protein
MFMIPSESLTDLCGLVVRVPGYRSRGLGFDSRRYQIFWEIMSLERGPLSLVSISEELLERNSSGSDLETREYGRGDPLRWPRNTLYPQKLALTSPTSGGRSVCIVRLSTKATEFVCSEGMENPLAQAACVCIPNRPLIQLYEYHVIGQHTSASLYFVRRYDQQYQLT